MRRVELPPRFAAWRRRARELLRQGVAPEAIEWRPREEGHQLALLGAPGKVEAEGEEAPAGAAPPRVPRRFFPLARRAACHRDPERWALLYRLLWRLTHGEPHLLAVTVDDDVHRLERMARSVKRDAHKMKAFVRFKRTLDDDGERYVAWHRPDHHVLELVAPFFAERFSDQRWAVLTPGRSAFWDGAALTYGPGAPPPAGAGDDLEAMWRTYYRSIFNPARLKVRAMKAEMPVRYWATLPEAALIGELIHDAAGRTEEMMRPSEYPPARAFFPGERALPALARAAQGCRACPLFADATQAVFGEGPRDARLVLVGEQPGDAEDRRGRPFVGPAGRVLDEVLETIGLDRGELYVTNVVKHFRFEERGKRRIHRSPGAIEVSACLPWFEEELARLTPRVIVCLGATAARAVIGPEVRVTRHRGEVFDTRWGPKAVPTYHPSALLRMRAEADRATARAAFAADLERAAGLLAAAV